MTKQEFIDKCNEIMEDRHLLSRCLVFKRQIRRLKRVVRRAKSKQQ